MQIVFGFPFITILKIFRYLIKKLTNIHMEMLTNSLRISPQYAVFCRHYFTRKRIIVTSFFVLSGALSWEPQESISPKTFNQHKHVTYDVSSNNYRPNDKFPRPAGCLAVRNGLCNFKVHTAGIDIKTNKNII